MLNLIDGYSISTSSAFFAIQTLTVAFPPRTNVYATASLSFLDTFFGSNPPNPGYAANAYIDSWTVHRGDGGGSAGVPGFGPNSVRVDNCATITFVLFAYQAAAIAQINIFSL
jgi:hypothetical protein